MTLLEYRSRLGSGFYSKGGAFRMADQMGDETNAYREWAIANLEASGGALIGADTPLPSVEPLRALSQIAQNAVRARDQKDYKTADSYRAALNSKLHQLTEYRGYVVAEASYTSDGLMRVLLV